MKKTEESSSRDKAADARLRKELIKGIVHLSRHKEFYGHIVQQFQKVYVHGDHVVQTASVGRFPGERFIKMHLNLDFFGDIFNRDDREVSWKYMGGVLEHEIIHCFPAGTMVSGSFLPIEEMAKGSGIIGSDGVRHQAEHTESRKYSGGLVSIKAMGILPFDVTDDHKILVADIGWKTVNAEPRRNIRVIRDVTWKDSQDVKIGDWLAVPRMVGNRCDAEIDVSQYMRGNKWSLPLGVRDGKIPLNEDISWLMGYYCAEGSASSLNPRGSKTKGSGQVTLSMNKKEMISHGARVSKIIEKWSLGGRPFVGNRKGEGCNIVFNSTVMARMLHDKVGRGAANKCVPDEIFWHKDERILKAFLRGYFDGDGAVSSRQFNAATVSKRLACQIQMMMARLGVWLNIFVDELSKKPPKVIHKNRKPTRCKDQYRMNTQGDDVRFLLGYDAYAEKKRPTKHHVMTDEFVFVRVRKVSRQPWSGTVYNLRSPTRDYVVNNVVVHNCVFGHLFVRLEDRLRANVAMDCVVNAIIEPDDKGERLPNKYVHPLHYQFPVDKSTLWYYTHLRDNPKFKQQCASGQFGVDGVLSHIMSSHSTWEDLKDDVVAKEFAKDIIRKAKDLCGKNYGNIPGEVVEQIEEMLKRERAIVPWAKVLRMFVATAAESVLDYTIKRRSKRFGTRPGTRKGDVLEIAVAIDTSGSIDDQQLKMFWNEIRWIWKNGAKIHIYECDTDISERSPFVFKGQWDGKVHGRGGTDLEPVLKEVEGKYDALIYFTDFYAPKIEHRYKIPILWVLTTEYEKDDYPYPWGKHIKIDEGKAHAA